MTQIWLCNSLANYAGDAFFLNLSVFLFPSFHTAVTQWIGTFCQKKKEIFSNMYIPNSLCRSQQSLLHLEKGLFDMNYPFEIYM